MDIKIDDSELGEHSRHDEAGQRAWNQGKKQRFAKKIEQIVWDSVYRPARTTVHGREQPDRGIVSKSSDDANRKRFGYQLHNSEPI